MSELSLDSYKNSKKEEIKVSDSNSASLITPILSATQLNTKP